MRARGSQVRGSAMGSTDTQGKSKVFASFTIERVGKRSSGSISTHVTRDEISHLSESDQIIYVLDLMSKWRKLLDDSNE